MSKYFIQIPALLRQDELIRIESLLSAIDFTEGKATASMAAKDVKNNLQAKENDKSLYQVQEIVDAALATSPIFNIAALPKRIYPPIVSKYSVGKYYGWHVDSPVMGDPPMRTDLAMTIFLSDPASYEGGELILQTASGNVAFKPAKGDAVLYPCQYLHCVNEIKSGERVAVVTWVQSNIASPEQRQILFDMNQVHALLSQRDMHSPEANLLLQTHSNLFRMWADV